MEIEFEKLEFGTTFKDTRFQKKWVKIDESGAVREDDPFDTIGSFDPKEIVIL